MSRVMPRRQGWKPQLEYSSAISLTDHLVACCLRSCWGLREPPAVERDGLEREPCACLSDTRVVRLDVRVIAKVRIRYPDVRTAKDHVVERIQCLETEREKHAFLD